MNKIIEFKNVSKEFLNGNIIANDNISFFVEKGEIHALAGENGAGKSTLVSMLFGLYKPTSGKILFKNKEIKYKSAIDAINDGMGMVHQHFQLVDKFTVAENISLGSEDFSLSFKEIFNIEKELKNLKNRINDLKKKSLNYSKQKEEINNLEKQLKNGQTSNYGFLNRRKINQEIDKLANLYNFNVKAKDKISSLTVGQEQKVEILKLIYKKSNILIFDEPTAMLTPQEIDQLLKIILQFKKEGKTIIIITHKLDEIKKVADRVSVLRKGKFVGTKQVKDITASQLSKMMVGYDIKPPTLTKQISKQKKVVLEVKDLSVKKRRVYKLKNINFSIKEGEIVSVAGVEGSGQAELVNSISGMQKFHSGSILLNKVPIKNLSIKKRNKLLSYIPEDRHKYGMILDLKVYENLLLKKLENNSKFGFLNRYKMLKKAQKIINNFDIRGARSGYSISRGLSGGNQQKMIVGREISANKNLLISFQATRGLDVGAINYIHSKIIEQRKNGKAILLVSYDLNEILKISDRVIVMNSGQINGILSGKDIDIKKIGILMSKKGKDK